MHSTLNRAVMTKELAEKHDLSHNEARDVFQTVLDTIARHLREGGAVTFHGFGTLAVKQRDGHVYTDPATGNRRKTRPRHFVRFTVSKKLQDSVREAQGDVEYAE